MACGKPGSLTLAIPDPDTMASFGRRLGRHLFAGAVVALVGPLGAGKTFLTRAIAEGLGVADRRVVTSPTFVLIQEYPADLPIYHFDAYRLRTPDEFFDLGVQEYFEGDGVCLVEWADKVKDCLPLDHLQIEISPTGESSRSLRLTGQGERYESLLQQIEKGED